MRTSWGSSHGGVLGLHPGPEWVLHPTPGQPLEEGPGAGSSRAREDRELDVGAASQHSLMPRVARSIPANAGCCGGAS